MTPGELTEDLKRSGIGSTANENSVVIHSAVPAEIQFGKGVISSIIDVNRRRVARYELPAQLITNLSSEGRAKRLMVHDSHIPPPLVHATPSAQANPFSSHSSL